MNKLYRLFMCFILGFGWLFLTPAYSDDPLGLASKQIEDLNKNIPNLIYKDDFEGLIKTAESKYNDALNAKTSKDNANIEYQLALSDKNSKLQAKNDAQLAVNNQNVIVNEKLIDKNNAKDALDIANINLSTAQSQYPSQGTPGLSAYLYDCWTYWNAYNNSPPLGCGVEPMAMGPWTNINFNFGSGGPAGLYDDYQIRWSGYIKQTQHWTPQFRTCGDDGMLIKINGITVVSNWWDRGGGCGASNGFYMESNDWVPIEIWWYENGGGANGNAQWNIGNGFVTIPSSALSTEIPIISPEVFAAQIAQSQAQEDYNNKLIIYNQEVQALQALQSNLIQADQNLTQSNQNLTTAQNNKDNTNNIYNQSIIDLNNAIDNAWKYYDKQLNIELQAAIAQAIANQPTPEPTIDPTPEQTKPSDPTPTPTPEITDTPKPTPTPEPTPTVEPSPTPSPQPTDINPSPTPQPTVSPVEPSPEPSLDKPTIEDTTNLIANLTSKDTLTKLTPEQKAAVANTLGIKPDEIIKVAELAKSNPIIGQALEQFSDRAKENIDAPMPYTLADATTELAAENLLSNPIGALTNIDLEKVLDPSQWGKDMTDDQREKAQEVVIPVIIASNLVAAAMTRRI